MASEKRLDLINRGELLDSEYLVSMDGALGYVVDSEIVRRAKRVDAVEVVHGRWLALEEYAEKIGADPTGYMDGWRFCSECEQPMRELYGWAYCPNCGAKMDGGNEDG